jgi:uncharacterized protein YjiS (DUF1127 family)
MNGASRHPEITRPQSFEMSFKSISNRVTAWRRYRNAIRELQQLSDRELQDLGISRYDIEQVARESAHMARQAA